MEKRLEKQFLKESDRSTCCYSKALREAVLNGVAELDREVEAVGICDRVTEGVAEELAEGVVKGVL